ncbi:MAG: MerR family transcriptional regulator [Hyphomicrobiales bacterium]|nr:MerR family transcriptional regulator [Hyphomicrobiales bacterium]
MSGFKLPDVARLTGLKPGMIDYLCRSKIVVPSRMGSRGRGRGKARVYSFGDVVLLRTYAKLLKAGVSVKRLKEAHGSWSRHFKRMDNQTPPTQYLVTNGERIFFKDRDEVLHDLNSDGQFAFAFVVDLSQMHTEVQSLAASPRKSA